MNSDSRTALSDNERFNSRLDKTLLIIMLAIAVLWFGVGWFAHACYQLAFPG